MIDSWNVVIRREVKTRLQKWKEAQNHEKKFWSGVKRRGIAMPEASLDYFSKILSLMEVNEFKNKTLLSIGSGPKGGILTLLPRGKLKVAVDSLLNRNLIEITSDINPLLAVAEELVIRDNSFDIVFCINALDHMASPHKALHEIFRVTRKTFVLMVHVVPIKRKALHTIFHSTYMAKLLLSRLLETPKPFSYVIHGAFLMLSTLFNDDIKRIIHDGYAHPHYLTFSEVITALAEIGFLIKKLKMTSDISYGFFKLDLFLIAEKSRSSPRVFEYVKN